jgi:hypothetical protein
MDLNRVAKKVAVSWSKEKREPAQSPEDVVNHLLSTHEEWEVLDDRGYTPGEEEAPEGEIYSIFFYSPMEITQEQYDELEEALGDMGGLGDTLEDFNTNNYIQIDVNTGHTDEEITNFMHGMRSGGYESENPEFNEVMRALQIAGYLQSVQTDEEAEPPDPYDTQADKADYEMEQRKERELMEESGEW